MSRIYSIVALCLALSACDLLIQQQEDIYEKERIREFDRLCKNHSSESVIKNSAEGAVNLWLDPGSASSGLGRVGFLNLPAYSQYRDQLLKALVTGEDKIHEVQFTYQVYTDDNELVGKNFVNKNCLGTFYAVVTKPEEAITSCSPSRKTPFNQAARYSIIFNYGTVSEYDIRPFQFGLRDNITGLMLAEQRSFELLYGGPAKTARWDKSHGSNQFARTCSLSPPDQLIKDAFK